MSRNTRFGRRADHGVERVVAVARGAGAVALVLQDARDQLADIGFVVDDENIGRHDQLTVSRGLRAGVGRRRRRGFRGEAQPHPGAARARNLLRGVAQLDAPAVLLENAADDGEAEPGALLARGHVGLEQARAVFLRQADAVVDHVDDDLARPRARSARHLDAAAAELGRAAPRRSPRSRS